MHKRVIQKCCGIWPVIPSEGCNDDIVVRSEAKEDFACLRIDFEGLELRVGHVSLRLCW